MNPTIRNHVVLTLAAGILSIGISQNSATAQSLLLDFGPTAVASPYLTLDPGHNLGAISGTDTSWNVLTTSATTSSLNYGDGTAASGLTLALGEEATAGNNIISYSTPIGKLTLAGSGGAVSGQTNLLGVGSIYGDNSSSTAVGRDGFFGDGTATAGNAIGLRLDGLASGSYAVYIMARNVNSDAASYPMNIYSTVGASAGTFNFSSLTANPEANTGYTALAYTGQYNTFANGENYVSINVTIGSGNSLFLAVDGGNNTIDSRGFLNMVEVVAVPEPATWALVGMGVFALLRVVQRKTA